MSTTAHIKYEYTIEAVLFHRIPPTSDYYSYLSTYISPAKLDLFRPLGSSNDEIQKQCERQNYQSSGVLHTRTFQQERGSRDPQSGKLLP